MRKVSFFYYFVKIIKARGRFLSYGNVRDVQTATEIKLVNPRAETIDGRKEEKSWSLNLQHNTPS